MAEQLSRRRRIVRRAVMAVTVPVFLVSGYFGSYLGVWWLGQHGLISLPTLDTALTTVYAPIHGYAGSGRWGSEYIIRCRRVITEDARERNARVRNAASE